jgi:SWI/SNF-related matrix-associated actin-dependent regulator 1 of chromatin subfamily A
MELTHRLGCYTLIGALEKPPGEWKPRGKGVYVTAHIADASKYYEIADSKAKQKLRPYVEQLIADIRASTALDGDLAKLSYPVGLLPRPYQAGGTNYALERQQTLNADAPRLGKTIQAILQANGIAARLPRQHIRWLIVCPANAKIQWKREVEKWRTFHGTVKILEGTHDTFDTDVVIMNWELVPYYGRELLQELGFDFITYDEAHRLRHLRSQTTKICLGENIMDNSIGATPGGIRANNRLFLTGTPIFTKPVNIWPIVRACDPASLGRNYYDFGTRYCGAERGAGIRFDPSGASNLEELQIRMRRKFMVRRERRDVAGEIPTSFDRVVFPKEKFENLLRAESSDLRAQFSSDNRSLAQILSDAGDANIAHAASSYEALSLAKLPMCIEHISEQVGAGEKVVVFAHHRSVLFRLKEAFGDCGFFPGGLTTTQRQLQIDRFKDDDTCRVMVAGITAAGEAISFAAANTEIFVEMVYSHGAMEQAEERIVLTEKTDPLSIQFLTVEDSADDVFFDIRATRREEAKRAMDANRLILPTL